MTNPELDKLLKSAPVSERPPEFWKQLPERISAKIHWQSHQQTSLRTKPHGFDLVDWALGVGVVAVVCVVVFVLQSGRPSPKSSDQFALAEKCYREIKALFPNQIQSIVFDETGPHIVLAEKADVPTSPPLYLKICGPHGCQEIVTFSGQQVRVNGDVCDVLTDAAGNVILAGKQLIWTSQSHTASAGEYRIEVRSVEASS